MRAFFSRIFPRPSSQGMPAQGLQSLADVDPDFKRRLIAATEREQEREKERQEKRKVARVRIEAELAQSIARFREELGIGFAQVGDMQPFEASASHDETDLTGGEGWKYPYVNSRCFYAANRASGQLFYVTCGRLNGTPRVTMNLVK